MEQSTAAQTGTPAGKQEPKGSPAEKDPREIPTYLVLRETGEKAWEEVGSFTCNSQSEALSRGLDRLRGQAGNAEAAAKVAPKLVAVTERYWQPRKPTEKVTRQTLWE